MNAFNRLRPRQNGRHFPDANFKCIFLNENMQVSIMISLKFVPKGLINNIPALVQIMAWRRPGDKPLSVPMMLGLLMHICVNRPQWVKKAFWTFLYQYIFTSFWNIVLKDVKKIKLKCINKCVHLRFKEGIDNDKIMAIIRLWKM